MFLAACLPTSRTKNIDGAHSLLFSFVYNVLSSCLLQVMVAVQESVYEYEGSINKFLMDDKGSTLVAVYGLPPVGHADDPTRGVLAALRQDSAVAPPPLRPSRFELRRARQKSWD